MEQYASAVCRKNGRELADDSLCLAAKLPAKQHDQITLRIGDDLAHGIDLAGFDTCFPCGECVVRWKCECERDCVFSDRSDEQKPSRLFRKPNASGVRDDYFRAAVSHSLADLLAGQRLQLFGRAPDQQNRLRVTDVAMRRQLSAEVVEERLERERVRGGVVVSAD